MLPSPRNGGFQRQPTDIINESRQLGIEKYLKELETSTGAYSYLQFERKSHLLATENPSLQNHSLSANAMYAAVRHPFRRA